MPVESPRFTVGRSSPWLLLAALTILAIPYIYTWTFFDVMPYDDEGTLMMTFRDLKEGSRLYNDTSALYGPFYYLSIGALFTTFHLPLTHDVVRFVAAGFWVACTVTYSGIAYLLTRSLVATSVSFAAALITFRYFPRSPTHPEEICMLLLGCIPYLFYCVERRKSRIWVMVIGGIAAALLLTKINIGLFAVMALALAATRVSGRQIGLKVQFAILAVASILLPLALTLPLFTLSWARSYCVFAAATILSAIIVWWRQPAPVLLVMRDWVAAASAAVALAIVIIAIVLLNGSTPAAVLNAVVLQNRHFIQNWYIPMWFGLEGEIALLVATASALAYVWFSSRPGKIEAAQQAVCWAKLVLGLSGLLWFFASYIIGDEARLVLFRILVPFCWLLIVPPATEGFPTSFTRAGIGLIAAFMVLYCFPVAGSQVNCAIILPMIMLPVLVHDAVADLTAFFTLRGLSKNLRWSGAVASCIAVGAALISQTGYAVGDYLAGVPLNLRGARLIHEEPKNYLFQHWAAIELSKCAMFYTFPGQLSYYFWTGKPSPTKINSNATLNVLTDAQQEQVIGELSGYPDLCILNVPPLQKVFDRGQLARHPPLLRYIADNFVAVDRRGPYELLKRKPVLH